MTQGRNRASSANRAAVVSPFNDERIADADSPDQLPVVEIFRPEEVTARLRGGQHDHGIPEAQLGLLVNRDRLEDVIGVGCEHLPSGKLANAVGGLADGERPGDLSRHRDEELLQDLHAYASDAGLPESCE